MGALILLVAINLGVLGIWFLPRPVWQWLEVHASSPRDLSAAIRAISIARVAVSADARWFEQCVEWWAAVSITRTN
jgi:hypothetical protein